MRYKGSFTVEAALIMPVILGVIVLFLYLAMFLHDRCTMQYVCQEAALEAVYHEKYMDVYAGEIIDDELEKKLIIHWDHETYVSSDDESISVKISARPQITLFSKVLTESAQFDIISVWSKRYRACLKNRDI
ncbi:MAG: pilus assembly protein [Lachnospiraceae bacterium]|nr:pilus assembly protein [Lachnospiraceae bacterium]